MKERLLTNMYISSKTRKKSRLKLCKYLNIFFNYKSQNDNLFKARNK